MQFQLYHGLGGAVDKFLPLSALSFPICEIEGEEPGLEVSSAHTLEGLFIYSF